MNYVYLGPKKKNMKNVQNMSALRVRTDQKPKPVSIRQKLKKTRNCVDII